MFALSERDEPIDTFTDGLWVDSIERVVVNTDGSLLFQFLNGTEVEV